MALTDLSSIHERINDVFNSGKDLDAFRLSEEQLAFYHENGFLAGVKLLDEQQINVLRNELT